MTEKFDLRRLQYEVEEWQEQNFPDTPSYRPLLGALEELGELAHAHLKNEQGIRGTPFEHYVAKVDAVADVIIYLAHYCNLNNIDIHSAVELTWQEVKKRDWKTDPEKGVVGTLSNNQKKRHG